MTAQCPPISQAFLFNKSALVHPAIDLLSALVNLTFNALRELLL